MWVCVSNNFDAKKVIADMLESLENKKPDLDSLDALQRKLKEVMTFGVSRRNGIKVNGRMCSPFCLVEVWEVKFW
ncbi:hypothetical protein IEQ34_007884 [Dendrobium chrysotoxum]|uniref:Uncharacterized protein n=1 Tax=Dendrobium chrysotoxum TaxID=161865 RepID=A0AAV7H331_DENCH|nr:hypothetical protein IEQ34_007884 [Dendrobium chrysotoxum]